MTSHERKPVEIVGHGRTKVASAMVGDEVISAKGSSQAQAIQKIAEKLRDLGVRSIEVDGFKFEIGEGSSDA